MEVLLSACQELHNCLQLVVFPADTGVVENSPHSTEIVVKARSHHHAPFESNNQISFIGPGLHFYPQALNIFVAVFKTALHSLSIS